MMYCGMASSHHFWYLDDAGGNLTLRPGFTGASRQARYFDPGSYEVLLSHPP